MKSSSPLRSTDLARGHSLGSMVLMAALGLGVLAGCSAPRPAPVENRSAPAQGAAPPQASATRQQPAQAAGGAATAAQRRPAASASSPTSARPAGPSQAQATPVDIRPIDSRSQATPAGPSNEPPPPVIRSDASSGARPASGASDSQARPVVSPPAAVPAQSPQAQTTPTQTAPAPLASAAPSGVASDAVRFMWPAPGKVLEGFSEPRNMGIAIDGQPGDPIVAAADGKVIFSGVGPRGYGNLIIVKHDNDVLSVYGHNRALMVREGDQVARGQKIAELGDSDADRPKLRFEVRREGKPVDPSRYLPAR